jgi:hypothetical protein
MSGSVAFKLFVFALVEFFATVRPSSSEERFYVAWRILAATWISRFTGRDAASAALFIVCTAACLFPISGVSPAAGCEFPTKIIGTTANANRPVHEYKVILRAPNYKNARAAQEHLVFMSVLTQVLFYEAASRSGGQCHIFASVSLFPDIRVIIKDSLEPQCSDEVREILAGFTPGAEIIGKISSALVASANSKSPSGFMSEAQNVLAEFLKRVYEEDSIMHALVSVRAENFTAISASSFAQWLQSQRSGGSLALAPLEMCKSDEEILKARPSNGELPYSNIIAPQTVTLKMPESQQATSFRLSHAVVVGSDPHPINWPLQSAATKKYCGRENIFSTGPENNSFRARTRCLIEVVRNTDTWMTLFCDPSDCPSEDLAEKVAITIANDSEIDALAKNSARNNQLRGPYLIKIVSVGN